MTPIQIKSTLQEQYLNSIDQVIYENVSQLINRLSSINYYDITDIYQKHAAFVDHVHQQVRIQISYFKDDQLNKLADAALSHNTTMTQMINQIARYNFNDLPDEFKHSPVNNLHQLQLTVEDAFGQTYFWMNFLSMKQSDPVKELIQYFDKHYQPENI